MTDNWPWLLRLLRAFAFPYYMCEQCVGQESWQGCYCAYYDAMGPCDMWRSPQREFARRLVCRAWFNQAGIDLFNHGNAGQHQ